MKPYAAHGHLIAAIAKRIIVGVFTRQANAPLAILLVKIFYTRFHGLLKLFIEMLNLSQRQLKSV
jgi:hypothetical protein